MAVLVKFFANFRDATGKEQEEVKGFLDIASLLGELTNRYGEKLERLLYSKNTRELREDVAIVINGKSVHTLGGLNTALKDGDVVAIFPPVAGG